MIPLNTPIDFALLFVVIICASGIAAVVLAGAIAWCIKQFDRGSD